VYLLGAVVALIRFAPEVPGAIALIFESAFSGHAAVGGFAGATVMQALRYGVARGLFSNEAGLGSAPIVHASAVTDHPVRQACYGIFEVFVDTLLVCLLSALVVLSTGAWTSGLSGAALAAKSFEIGLPGEWGHFLVSFGIITFAFSTVVGWAYYGETGIVFLAGVRARLPYRLAWIGFVFVGAIGGLHTVWSVADTLNGLMAVPNLIAVLGSLGLLRRLIREFFDREKAQVR
jgi:alanine or glycine:cation symporter, AGCS family